MSLELQAAREYLKAFAVRLNTVLDNVDSLYRRLEAADEAINVFDQAEQLVRQGRDQAPSADFTFGRARLDRAARAEQDGVAPQLAQRAKPAAPAGAGVPGAARDFNPDCPGCRRERRAAVSTARKPAAKAQPAAIPVKMGRPRSAAVARAHAEQDAKVLQAMTAAAVPLPSATLVAKTKILRWALKDSLKRLRAAGRIRLKGNHRSARWLIVAPKTPAATGPTTRVNGQEFETVWNGSKDAPSLIGDRVQRKA